MPNHRRLLDVLLLALRPARWSILGFRFVPLVLLAAGAGAVVYGGFYHRIPVSETHEEQVMLPVERPMPPPMAAFSPTDAFGQPTGAFGMAPGAFGPPPEAFAPPVKLVPAVKTTKITTDEWELAVNRAVTVAGIFRDLQGEIVRASGGAGGPAFCPS